MKTPDLRPVWLGAVLVLLASGASAENWPQWRGPHFNGSSTETGLPTTFSATENVAWTADLPGVGGATPVVWNDYVFVTAQVPRSNELWALCLSARDGTVRWARRMGRGFRNKQGNTGASPSPITDGRNVWFHFGTGELAAFDLAGRQVWRRNIAEDHGPFEVLWDYGATGLLYDGRLFIPVIHGGPHRGRGKGDGTGFLLGVDPATGRDLWKRPRPGDAVRESRQAYTTPTPFEAGGSRRVLVTGADYVTAHDAATGKEVWRSPTYNPRRDPNYRTVVSPAVTDGRVVVCPPRGARRFYAAAVGRADWAWEKAAPSPDVCTPLVYRGKVFVLVGTHKRLLCLEPETGRTVWDGDLGGRARFQASPTGADGKIYCISMKGEVVVLAAGDRFEVLHRADLGGTGVRASIAVAGGRLFVRTDRRLYCIGRPTP